MGAPGRGGAECGQGGAGRGWQGRGVGSVGQGVAGRGRGVGSVGRGVDGKGRVWMEGGVAWMAGGGTWVAGEGLEQCGAEHGSSLQLHQSLGVPTLHIPAHPLLSRPRSSLGRYTAGGDPTGWALSTPTLGSPRVLASGPGSRELVLLEAPAP